MSGIDLIRLNNVHHIAFKENTEKGYKNEVVFENPVKKKPILDFLENEVKEKPVIEKKKPVIKRIADKFSNFISTIKEYYQYKSYVNQALKEGVISKKRAITLISDKRISLFHK